MKKETNKAKTATHKQVEERGITLIALVVTIVVLIILATVSMSTIIGENGIIQKAQKAKEVYENSVITEDDTMEELLKELEDMVPKQPAGEETTKPEGWTSGNITPIADGNGGAIPLPNGFYYVGGNINTGLVISDKQGDTMGASGTSMGNQFVWIPVANQEALTRTRFDENGNVSDDNLTSYTEPFGIDEYIGYETEASEYEQMQTQVLKYGGFYIGRYEAGVNSTTLRDDQTVAQTVVSKKGVAPYNYVPWGTAMNDPSEIEGRSGAVYLAKSMYSGSSSITSTLVYGCQWDAMCRYIGDANRTTPTKEDWELTGSVSTDVSKNIYDLAGNCWEWTMEAYGYIARTLRGGRYSKILPISNRDTYEPVVDYSRNGFRCALYINN